MISSVVSDMFSELPKMLPYIIIFLIWLIFLVLFCTTIFLNSMIVEKRDNYEKVYEGCDESTVKYIYILRFEFGLEKKGFNYKKNTIIINVLNKKREIMTSLRISPELMSKSYFISKTKKILKYLLLRGEPLVGIKYLDINHDCSSGGELEVKTVELQDIDFTKANIAYVDCVVQNLTKEKLHTKQLFPFASREYRELESELRQPSKLNFTELLVFLFLSINYITLSSVFVIPCETEEVLCNNYKNSFISVVMASLASSIGAMIIFAFTTVLYTGFVKYFFSKNYKYFDIIRILYLAFIVIISIICGGISAFFGSNDRHFKVVDKHNDEQEIYWCYAVVIGCAVFAFMVIGLTVMAYLFGFCSEYRESEVMVTLAEEESEASVKRVKSPLKANPQKTETSHSTHSKSPSKEIVKTSPQKEASVDPKPIPKTPSNENIGDNYSKQIGVKSKSVSQHKGSNIKNSEHKTSDKTNVKTNEKKEDLEEADNYYDSLMTHKKIKSISQYKGVR